MIVAVRRLASIAFALALAAGPLAAGGFAVAKDHGEGHGRPEMPRGEMQRGGRGGDEGRWGGGRQGPPGWRGGEERGGGRWERAEPRSDPRGDFRGEPR